tara:strand:- start:3505 stop:3795 length:291 start_codon:yes stop_codon:yes gene_type:complete
MVKVFLSNNGQMKITVPKAIAEAMQLHHKDNIEFFFNGSTWEIKKNSKKSQVKVFSSKNKQMKITIPKAIAIAMQLKHKTKMEFIFTGKTWELRKK